MSGFWSLARRVYRHLPPQASGLAASLYGRYLRSWRYGPETETLVEAALEREGWSEDRWRAYQEERLAEVLHRAATRVPYYRDRWAARRGRGDRASWEDLGNWPLLRKSDLRDDPRAFLADDVDSRRMFRLNTSGSTGTPLTMWRSQATTRAWYALFEARTRVWYGVDRSVPWAILGGQVVVPASRDRPPFWVWNAGLHELYLSTLHLSEANVAAYVEAMARHGVEYLYGYASSMYWLASMARARGVRVPPLRVAISNAEPLHPYQRELIGEVFGCPVRDTYGMAEIVAAGSECDRGVMHLWPEVGVVEVLRDDGDAPAPAREVGRFVCTGLLNPDMPLVRYEVGDRGALAEGAGDDGCGRMLPRIERIEGRTNDNLVTPDGRRVFWINPIFYELPVREAQVVQEAIDDLVVRVVPDAGYGPEVAEAIAARLRERLGAVRVRVERVEAIERGPNGKFRAVINRLDAS